MILLSGRVPQEPLLLHFEFPVRKQAFGAQRFKLAQPISQARVGDRNARLRQP